MKLNYIILLSVTLLGTSGYSQTGGGAGTGGTSTGGTGSDAGTAPVAPGGNSSIATRPGLPPPEGFQPGRPLGQTQPQQQTQPTQPGLNPQDGTAANSNPVGIGTNQPGTDTNQFGTNLPATSRPGLPNRIMATNTPGLLTNNPLLMRDQALSESDRKLLAQIRTSIFGSSQATASPASAPVHFILRDGVVRIVGTVPNPQEQQRIDNLVQQVPGVVRVYDALQIGGSAGPGQSPTVPGQNPTTPGQRQ